VADEAVEVAAVVATAEVAVLEKHHPTARLRVFARGGCFEFILRIDKDPLGIKRMPNKFA
jgi:hypothetical protein